MDHIIIAEGSVGRTDFFSISRRCYILYWPYSLCKRNGTSFCVLSWRSGHNGYLHKCSHTQIPLNTFIIMHMCTCTQTHTYRHRDRQTHTHTHMHTYINTSPIHTHSQTRTHAAHAAYCLGKKRSCLLCTQLFFPSLDSWKGIAARRWGVGREQGSGRPCGEKLICFCSRQMG